MKRYKWLFWSPEERETSGSTPSSGADTEACREWTPFLTALFDGEADEDGALRARRHLLVCERCARAWLDWNQTRSLLINHSAPPPPPSLLWRIRLACRLGRPASSESAVPELSAQILARTSRQKAAPAFGFSWPQGFRLNSPFLGAFAMGAFVLFIARSTLLVSPPATSSTEGTIGRMGRVQPRPVPVLSEREEVDKSGVRSKFRLAAPRHAEEDDEETEPRALRAALPRRFDDNEGGSQSSLERARRERESLGAAPARLASYQPDEPLPMLKAPRPILMDSAERAPTPPHPVMRAPKLAHLPRIAPRPVASAPRNTPVLLASFDASEPVAAPARVRSARASLASAASVAPLRISAPHALPITVSQSPASDDAGLDELDSTVQEYRAVLASDDFTDANSG